jgi:hypothetical protein
MGQTGFQGPLRLRADVVATVLEDGALLLDLETKYFYLLNPSGWAITQLFERGTSLEHARSECARAGAGGEVAGEIDGFVGSLVAEDLLETVDRDEAPSFELSGAWSPPTLEKQDEPLQRVIVNAFDPTIPLAE